MDKPFIILLLGFIIGSVLGGLMLGLAGAVIVFAIYDFKYRDRHEEFGWALFGLLLIAIIVKLAIIGY